MTDLVEVPEELAYEIRADEGRNAWPWHADRNATHWAATPYRHNGEQVLLLLDGPGDDPRPATRSSVEATYGPLEEVPHCPGCGSYLFYRGVCRSLACAQTDTDSNDRSIRPVIEHALTVYYDGNAELARTLIDQLLTEGRSH